MSVKWNDCEFNPKTMILDIEGQSEFLDEIALDYSSVQHFAAATPVKCETKFNEMMVALKSIIQNWEASRQGKVVLIMKTKKRALKLMFGMN